MVIAIIGILASMLLPTLQKARERARQTRCMVNLKQIYVAVVQYESDYDCIVPFYDGRHDTWEDDLKSYVKPGKDTIYYRQTPDGRWHFYEYMLFYCPTRHAMGQQFSMNGYYTNYAPNTRVMSLEVQNKAPSPWDPPGSNKREPW